MLNPEINLCDTCARWKYIPTCFGDDIVFGCECGGEATNDNVCECENYTAKG